MKYNKGYSHYLNNIDKIIKKCEKNNYDKDYIHFDTLQLDSIDYDNTTYHTELYNYTDISNLILLDKLFIRNKLDIRITSKLNTSMHYNLPNSSDLELIKSKFKIDIDFYKKYIKN